MLKVMIDTNIFISAALFPDGKASAALWKIEDLIYAASRGGWPTTLRKKSEAIALLTTEDYVNNICESDISTCGQHVHGNNG